MRKQSVLQSWKKQNGLTYDGLAEILSISRDYAFKIFTGKRKPGRVLGMRIKEATGLTLEEIFGD